MAFHHPLAGLQLVKGGIEPGENPRAAALRELREEAGIAANTPTPLIVLPFEQACWHLIGVQSEPLPDSWTHDCADDGGHRFAFFWQDPKDQSAFVYPFADVLRWVAA